MIATGRQIAAARALLGWSQKDLADASGLRQVTVTPEFFSSARSANEKDNEGLGTVVNRLIGARHEACDGASDQNFAVAARAHVTANFLDQVDRAHDVRVDDPQRFAEILI